jgi:uncharacterized damage-inducible protein DinB
MALAISNEWPTAVKEYAMAKTPTSPTIGLLLDLINQSYNQKSWHGTNLRGSVRGLTAREALWRPSPTRHNIWEIVVHCAYWKYVVRRRILGEKRGSFPMKGSNWFRRTGKLTQNQWRNDIRLLEESHRSLRETVAQIRAKELNRTPSGSTVTNAMILTGIASHDIYHAGQIQILKRLMK